jgi:uncharacterized protein YkwD
MHTSHTRRLTAVLMAAIVLMIAGLYSAGQVSAKADGGVERVVSVRDLPRSPRTTSTTVRPTATTTPAPAPTTSTPVATTPAPTTPAPTTTTKPATPTTVRPPVTTPPTTVPAPPTTTPPVATTVAPVAGGLPVATQQQMLALVNAKRATGMTCGSTVFAPVPALTLNGTLTKASDAYALDMANKNYFSHTGADGSDPGMRITAAGYRWSAWAENIAAGQPTPEAVIAGWFDSPGHCVNFMSSAVTQVGFGKADNASSTYGTYWASDLGRPG